MDKEISTVITYHHDFPRVNKSFGIDLVIPAHVKQLIGIDGINRAVIRTTLDRNKKGFAGKAVISSAMLKGITDNLLVPEISIKHGEDHNVTAKLDLGGVSFTQEFSRFPKDRHCESVFFGGNYLDVMNHRIHHTYQSRNSINVSGDVPLLAPRYIKEMLEKGAYHIASLVRKSTYEVVRETTNQHIEKMKHSGLIVKRTVTFFNKERKEHIEYIVISALGSFRVFEGEHTNFEKETKTGYVLFADPTKPTK